MNKSSIILIAFCSILATKLLGQAKFIKAFGYDSCVLIAHENVRVIICPQAGGRVLEYSLNGINAMYVDSSQNGWVSTPSQPRLMGHISGGRFDIGPSRQKPNTNLFFFGAWRAEITGYSSVRLTSQLDALTGLQIQRTFTLLHTNLSLVCTQTILNNGPQSQMVSHWSRTMAAGHGIVIMPVPKLGRFPNKYIMYMNRDTINMMPRDKAISVDNDLLIISNVPAKPKLEMDVSCAGWMAYATPGNVLFVKQFAVDPRAAYAEVSAANASIWYNGTQMTEIEPIGPVRLLKPGETYQFEERWSLLHFPFPANRTIDHKPVLKLIEKLEKS